MHPGIARQSGELNKLPKLVSVLLSSDAGF